MKLFFIHLLLLLISMVEVVTINDPYPVFVQSKIKSMNLKVFNLIRVRVNETRFLVQHE